MSLGEVLISRRYRIAGGQLAKILSKVGGLHANLRAVLGTQQGLKVIIIVAVIVLIRAAAPDRAFAAEPHRHAEHCRSQPHIGQMTVGNSHKTDRLQRRGHQISLHPARGAFMECTASLLHTLEQFWIIC